MLFTQQLFAGNIEIIRDSLIAYTENADLEKDTIQELEYQMPNLFTAVNSNTDSNLKDAEENKLMKS